jgi:hypothetical protein
MLRFLTVLKKKFKFHKFVTRVIKMINFNYYKHRYTNMATSNKYKCTQTHSKFIWYVLLTSEIFFCSSNLIKYDRINCKKYHNQETTEFFFLNSWCSILYYCLNADWLVYWCAADYFLIWHTLFLSKWIRMWILDQNNRK